MRSRHSLRRRHADLQRAHVLLLDELADARALIATQADQIQRQQWYASAKERELSAVRAWAHELARRLHRAQDGDTQPMPVVSTFPPKEWQPR